MNFNFAGANERNITTVLSGFIEYAQRFKNNYARFRTIPNLDEETGEMVLRGTRHEMSLDMTDAARYLQEQLFVLEDPASIVGASPSERRYNAKNMLSFFEEHLEFAREMRRLFGVELGPDSQYLHQLERAVELSRNHVKNNGSSSPLVSKFNLILDHKEVCPPDTLTPKRAVVDSRRTIAKRGREIIGDGL